MNISIAVAIALLGAPVLVDKDMGAVTLSVPKGWSVHADAASDSLVLSESKREGAPQIVVVIGPFDPTVDAKLLLGAVILDLGIGSAADAELEGADAHFEVTAHDGKVERSMALRARVDAKAQMTVVAILTASPRDYVRVGGAPLVASITDGVRPKATAAPKITRSNWKTHPQVVEIRKEVEAALALKMANKLTRTERKLWECHAYDGLRFLYRDSARRPRIYEQSGGSDDSMVTYTFHYNLAGDLRFVFIEAGAVNGSRLEHRIYFDTSGKRIWEEHTYTEGPGYTFPSVWPDEELAHDPVAAFNSTQGCN